MSELGRAFLLCELLWLLLSRCAHVLALLGRIVEKGNGLAWKTKNKRQRLLAPWRGPAQPHRGGPPTAHCRCFAGLCARLGWVALRRCFLQFLSLLLVENRDLLLPRLLWSIASTLGGFRVSSVCRVSLVCGFCRCFSAAPVALVVVGQAKKPGGISLLILIRLLVG